MHPNNLLEDADREVSIDYTNYRGERGPRRIIPHTIEFKRTPFHPESEQWILIATDVEKNELRGFAMKDIHSWTPIPF